MFDGAEFDSADFETEGGAPVWWYTRADEDKRKDADEEILLF